MREKGGREGWGVGPIDRDIYIEREREREREGGNICQLPTVCQVNNFLQITHTLVPLI